MAITSLTVFLFILAASYLGYRIEALSFSGGITAIFVGEAIYLGFEINGLILLGIFFITSSLWSKFKAKKKSQLDAKLEKGSKRDWRQVAANGGIAALIAITYKIFPYDLLLPAFCIAIAAANSDTWASEIGSLSRKKPILIRTLKRTDKGTSGAVSFLGTAAALMGSLTIAAIGAALFQYTFKVFLLVFILGFIGNIVDTLIGAFIQRVNQCQVCLLLTEKSTHCHTNTVQIRGVSFLENDFVNFLSIMMSVILYFSISI